MKKDVDTRKTAKMLPLHFQGSNGPVDEAIEALMEMVGGVRRPPLVREMILAALKAGQEDDEKADLKLMNTSLKEMRFTGKIFGPYRHIKKVTVFGSARIREDDPTYRLAVLLGQKLKDAGYMVITGGGPGIMQAVNEGAGKDFSFGINIRLPFEQKSNPVVDGSSKSITYKYFFNRKIAFIKEAHAVALFPGGFGTLDEAMETLTLLQTGKRDPMPLILIDVPDSSYWSQWFEFLKEELMERGYIGAADFHLIERVDSVSKVVESINRFYSRYHSLRYVNDKLVIRLNSPVGTREAEQLKEEFADILVPGGDIQPSGPLREEANEPELRRLPRLVLDFNRMSLGRLRKLIDTLNDPERLTPVKG
jgi:uncharacterized protein (TIGR00730 family)